MSFLTNIKERLFRKRTKAETSRPPAVKPGEKINLTTAKKITIIFIADSAEDRKAVDKWRDTNRRSGCKIKVVGFFEQEVGSASFDFEIVSIKDLNWYGVPQGEVVKKIQRDATDLLLRLGPARHPVLDFLATTKPAKLKVGPFAKDSTNPYHLQFDGSLSVKLKDQLAAIEQIFTFTNATSTSKV
ncbi:MAG: hypothetical protein ACI81P_000697 [Neolewinella sp.]|jgi:hypothetical protein